LELGEGASKVGGGHAHAYAHLGVKRGRVQAQLGCVRERAQTFNDNKNKNNYYTNNNIFNINTFNHSKNKNKNNTICNINTLNHNKNNYNTNNTICNINTIWGLPRTVESPKRQVALGSAPRKCRVAHASCGARSAPRKGRAA
jgi:hypothetical protein